jgi:hypothetical protein
VRVRGATGKEALHRRTPRATSGLALLVAPYGETRTR